MALGAASLGTLALDIVPDTKAFGGLLGKGVAAAAGLAAAGGIALVAAGLKIGATFDSAFDTIRVGTGATGTVLEGLKDDFRGVFTTIPTDAGLASQAVSDLNTRLGLSGPPLQTLSGQFLELSRITKTDLGANIESVTRLFGDWGVATEDQSGRLDMLFRAAQSTGVPVDHLSRLLVQYGAPLRQLGFGLETSTALLGKFEKEGVNTELVMGSLRIALGKMARSGEDAETTFQRVVGEIENAGSASEANALALELFGARAGPDMAAAIREGRFELGDLFETVSGGSETIMKAASDTADWREGWTLFKNQLLTAVEPAASQLFNTLGEFMKTHGPAIATWLGVAIPQAIAVASTAFGMISTFVQTVVIPAFSAVRGAIDAVVKFFSQSSASFTATGQKLSSDFAGIWEGIKGVLASASAFVQAVLSVLAAFWERHGATITAFAQAAWGAIVTIIRGALQVIKGVFDFFGALFRGDWRGMWDAIVGIVRGLGSVLGGAVRLAFEAVKVIFSTVGVDLVNLAIRIGGDLVRGLWNGIAALGGWLWGKITGFVRSKVTGAINAILGRRSLPKVGIDIGRDLVESLAQGMDQAVGRVAGAAGRVAGAMVPAPAGGPMAAAGAAGLGSTEVIQLVVDGRVLSEVIRQTDRALR